MRYRHAGFVTMLKLFLLLMLATACTSTRGYAQSHIAQVAAQRAQTLAGVRSKLAQLRAEQEINRAALERSPSENERNRLNARAAQIQSTLTDLRAQEKELTHN
jgi:hypothetical protein